MKSFNLGNNSIDERHGQTVSSPPGRCVPCLYSLVQVFKKCYASFLFEISRFFCGVPHGLSESLSYRVRLTAYFIGPLAALVSLAGHALACMPVLLRGRGASLGYVSDRAIFQRLLLLQPFCFQGS